MFLLPTPTELDGAYVSCFFLLFFCCLVLPLLELLNIYNIYIYILYIYIFFTVGLVHLAAGAV